MDSHLKLILPLSLKEIVLREVAALYCSNSDSLGFFYQSLQNRIPTCKSKEWLEATGKEILKLGLPESLNKQVVDRVQVIGFEIRKWKKLNRSFWFGSDVENELPDLSKPCFSTMKTIDYKKIAEQYVLCDRIKDWRRYDIASSNCLENYIPHLWYELSEREKKGYADYLRVPRLEYCWPYILKGKQSKLDDLWRESGKNLTSFNQWAFEESAENDNQVAVEYFFQKLTAAEREVSLMRTAYNVFEGDVLCYLLSLMTPEQQMEIIKARPIYVLLCFFDWPQLHLLPENADLIWKFLPQSDYGNLLDRISDILRRGDNCFPKLFQEFFNNAPNDFIKKSFVLQESSPPNSTPPACRLLCALLDYEDSESIEVMFRHADAATTLKLIFHNEVFVYFYECILREKWQGVEACLQEAALSREYKDTLKESFRRFLDQIVSGSCVERKFKRFFDFLSE